jgi:uncharacterized protein (TIGR03905 family)
MKMTYTTSGTCSRAIDIELQGDLIREVRFTGGCSGNTRGVAALVQGMQAAEAVRRLKGIVCRAGTSCPDQLARALEEMTLEKAV